MNAKLTSTTLTINGKRAGIRIDAGPWVHGVNPDTIKIRPRKNYFPADFGAALSIENNSDMREDYFEKDCIRLLPGHPLYAAAKAAA